KEKMAADIKTVLRANSLTDGYIRVVVTRGVGDLGLDPRKCPKASYFIIADNISLYSDELYKNGLEIATVSTRRNIPESLNPRVKSLNYLNNIMAKIEGTQRGVAEALMLNSQGYVAECTGDNIFIIKDGVITTPPASAGALLGVTQEAVIELARKRKIEVRKELFTRYCVFTADECFLTGTAAEIIPVVALDGRKIGDGKPGGITTGLIADFRKLANSTGEVI
ncbi:MAG: aminotransferase class IV, partial [Candidatus Omnitrophota bacterium]